MTGEGMGTEAEYAGFWRRALAITIDDLFWLVGPGLFGFYAAIDELAQESEEAAGIAIFIWASIWFNYFTFCEWKWGRTIGKATTGIEVQSLDGTERLTFSQASMRNLLRLIDFFVIGWVLIASDERKQRLGDRAAKTVVVRSTKEAPAPTAATGAAAAASAPPAAANPPTAAPTPAPIAAPPPPASARLAAGYPPPPQAPGPPHAAAAAAAEPETPMGSRGRLPEIDWSYRQTWWGVLIGFVAGFLFAPALVLPFDPELESDAGLLVAQGLLGGTLVGVSVAVATHWRFADIGRAFGQLGVRRFAPGALGWMLLVLFAYYVFAGLFASFVLEPKQEDIGDELGVGSGNILVAVFAVVLIAGVAPVAEELFFRGFIFSGFRNRFSFWPAALIAGVLFGVVHVATGPTAAIPLAALGFGLCWLYERTGSLWPCIFAHMINNGLALIVLGLD
jgi:membrane protease YdiL (CAAX protease family)/uncharacterized RDD family membrane protein YckC